MDRNCVATDRRRGEENAGGLETFDELYDKVCTELRQSGKSIDLCEKINAVQSDLNRVQLLLSHCPSISNSNLVRKFRNSIRDQEGGKSQEKGEQLLSTAKSFPSTTTTDMDQNIEILIHALLFSPWGRNGKTKKMRESGQKVVNEFEPRMGMSPSSTRCVDTNCVHYLVKRLIEKNELEVLAFPVEQEEEEETEEDEKKSPFLLPDIYLEMSQLFFQRGDHQAVILNLVTALSFGLPCTNVTFTVAANAAKSLQELGFLDEASQLFHHALQLLRNEPRLDKEGKCKETILIVQALKEIKTRLSSSRSQHEQVPSKSKQENFVQEELYEGRHGTMVSASSALELRYDIKRGRHAVARTSIPPGAAVIMDSPYAWTLYPRMYRRLCQHCCLPFKAPIPCQHCASVLFCSWECWRNGETYHKFECPILKSLDSSPALGEMGLLCYRIVCTTDSGLLEEYTAPLLKTSTTTSTATTTHSTKTGELDDEETKGDVFNNSERPAGIFLGLDSHQQDSLLDPRNIVSVLAMTPNSEQRPAGDIVKRALAAIYLTLCLRHTGYFLSKRAAGGEEEEVNKEPKNSTEVCNDAPEDQLSPMESLVAAVILRLSQSLSCNAYGMNSVVGHNNRTAAANLHTIEPLGGACYPTISIVNHSCNPNVFRFTWGNTCVVRTIRRIHKGEEILDSYGPLFTTMPRAERRNLLKSQYFFHCHCQPCEENWPLFKDFQASAAVRTVQDVQLFKCPACSKAVPGKTCTTCNNSQPKFDRKKISQILRKSEERYLTAKQALIAQNQLITDCESILSSHLDTLERYLIPPHRLIIECQELLKLAWNLSAAAEGAK